MKIKLIVFDLDGVLIDAKKIHFDALNTALKVYDNQYVIDWKEHLIKYDGLKTKTKLEILSKEKKVPEELHNDIWTLKQKNTIKLLETLETSEKIFETLKYLKQEDYKIACCTNSIKDTTFSILSKLKILEYFDLVLTNEDVKNCKPHPEIYWNCMSFFGILPNETLIIEDSPCGLLAANRSNSNVLRVKNSKEVSYKNITSKIKQIENMKNNNSPAWKDEKMNILIPMAGFGSRFEKAGYVFPKPLIDVNGKPMIQTVVENLNVEANYIFVVRKEHKEKYNLNSLLNLIAPKCKVIELDHVTEGAACTTLLAKEYINNEYPLIIANSDQYVEWNSNEFLYKMNETECDAGILTFKSVHPKWSFAKLNEDNFVCEVAEKNPISDIATVGIYYWKKGSDYVKYAEKMIEQNIRVNNEFYVCPVFNEAIKDNKKIITYNIEKMWGLGTPEDLQHFLKNYL